MKLFERIAAGACALACLAAGGPALAQQSPSFRLTEWVLNGGGDPAQGTYASSASYRIKLDAIGEAVIGRGLASATYHSDGGFVPDYPPPGEVLTVRFSSKTVLQWSPERSVGTYDVYRDPVGSLPVSFGSCFQGGLTAETATDASTPPAGVAWFYLVTAENRLLEEGTKGYRSSGAERPNSAPCP